MHKIKRSRNLGKTPDSMTSMQPHETPVKLVKIADFETNSGVVVIMGKLWCLTGIWLRRIWEKSMHAECSRIGMNLCILGCIV
jgi:uncharacterized membrane protein